ncbi:hypothetical protein D3C75_433930 [compost metagenome]
MRVVGLLASQSPGSGMVSNCSQFARWSARLSTSASTAATRAAVDFFQAAQSGSVGRRSPIDLATDMPLAAVITPE